MAFIGIITSPEKETYTRNVLYRDFSSQHDQVLFITKQNIDNIKNIRFETILIDTEDTLDEEILIKILKNSKNLIINSDIVDNINFITKSNLQLITFGFNQKSTVTISSVTNENILMCIQRKIKNISGEIIEPQEIKININDNLRIIANTVIGVQILRFIYNKI